MKLRPQHSNRRKILIFSQSVTGLRRIYVYKNMGTSFPEAVRMFAAQSVQEQAMPFVLRVHPKNDKKSEEAYENFITFRGSLPSDFDYDKELTNAREGKYNK